MRIVIAALCLLATGAGAECLPPGKTPAKVTFADGAVIDGITRQGNILRYQSRPEPDQIMGMEALWGIYPLQSSFNGNEVRYDWQGTAPPDPATLREPTIAEYGTYRVVGTEVRLAYANGETETLTLEDGGLNDGRTTMYPVKPLPDGSVIEGTISSSYASGFGGVAFAFASPSASAGASTV